MFIVYEQPVNELIRVCLRLEHLFLQLDLHMANNPDFHTRDVIRLAIEILNVLDRPDLKSKFTQELHRLTSVFAKMHSSPDISKDKLDATLKSLAEPLEYLVHTRGKIAQNLRDNDFISNIRTHLLTPGGDCCFEIPSFHYWLHQPAAEHITALKDWLAEFQPIRSTIELLLTISRDCAKLRQETAENGFFHTPLNTQVPTQLVRVLIPQKIALYPEISVGKHRMNIRFYVPTITERAKQTNQSIDFQLAICNI